MLFKKEKIKIQKKYRYFMLNKKLLLKCKNTLDIRIDLTY